MFFFVSSVFRFTFLGIALTRAIVAVDHHLETGGPRRQQPADQIADGLLLNRRGRPTPDVFQVASDTCRISAVRPLVCLFVWFVNEGIRGRC